MVYRKLDQLKQDRRIFNKERLRFDKEVVEFRQSKTCMEGEISQLLEEYDQLRMYVMFAPNRLISWIVRIENKIGSQAR